MDGKKSCRQKKIAIINDLSGYGRCSLTVAIPIISAMRIQCCPVPTAILSNHTGFRSYYFDDYTKHLSAYVREWEKLSLEFDGILTGFLGSHEQIELVIDFLGRFAGDNTKIVVDPIMGDDGRVYTTYTEDMCRDMKRLSSYADILTPNLTEACILTDTPYVKKSWKMGELQSLAAKLALQGRPGRKIVITGIRQGDYIANLIYDETCGLRMRRCHRVGKQRPGTGDIFSSIIAADAVNGEEFSDSVGKASRFIKKSLEISEEMAVPLQNGVAFEEILCKLH